MENLQKALMLHLRRYHLVWLVRSALDDGIFEDFFGELSADVDIKKTLEGLAWADDSARIRCAAIKRLDNGIILKEIERSSNYPAARMAAQRRLIEIGDL
ncbi:MAG: hypothetical protein IJ217_01200 [Clostridia bacterium]|nr:hypothetical protein [Clostridia bacterium]